MEDVADAPVLNVSRAGRPGLHRHRRGAAARPPVVGQRGGPLPGRLAALEGFPAQGAGLGPRQDRQRLPRLHPGLQHQHRHPRRRRGAAPSPAQPRGQPALHVRPRADGLPLDEPRRPDRGSAGARGAAATSPPTGTARSPGWSRCVRGASGSAVVLASGRASTESLGLVRRLLERFDVTAAVQVPLGEEAPLAGIPNLALRRERAPNLAGAGLLGYTADWSAAMRQVGAGRGGHRARRRARAGGRGRAGGGARRNRRARHRHRRRAPPRRAGAAGDHHGRGERHLCEPRPAAAAVPAGPSQPGMARPAWWVAGEVLAGPGPSADAPPQRPRPSCCWASGGRCSPG